MFATDLKKRSDIHWARKTWHVVTVFGMAMFYDYMPEHVSLITLGIAALLFIPFDVVRQRKPALNGFLVQLFKPILRESEVNKLAGTTFLFLGVGAVVLVFPKNIALLTLLFLAFADPIASYFGIRYGKDKILGQKSLQGFFAAFVVCAVVTYAYLLKKEMLLERIWVVSLVSGLIGALAELVPIFDLDDNLTLPILSASGLWVTFYLFGA